MLTRLLPAPLDNGYRGPRLAFWLFGLIVGVTLLQSVLSVVDAAGTLQNADGIPLAQYAPGAAQTVVALFALLGFTKLVGGVLCAVALARYRSAVPGLFGVLLLTRLGGLAVLAIRPLARVGRPPGVAMNVGLLALLVTGLALSLRPHRASGRAAVGQPVGVG